MVEPIPVIVVGGGMAANRFHLPAWHQIREVQVAAICDVERNRATETARIWRVSHTYEDLGQALEQHDRGIVDIVTPPSAHATLCIRAMEQGHHVLLEKPIAMTSTETERIHQEYLKRQGELKFCVVQNMLMSPRIQKVRSILAQRKIEILSLDVRMLHTPDDEMFSDPNHWVHSLPAGRFGENLIHPVYLLRNLMGSKLTLRDVYSTKRGRYEWIQADELHATFDSFGKYGSVHISFNGSRRTLPFSLFIYGKNAIVYLDGTNATCLVQGPLTGAYLPHSKLARTKILRDELAASASILGSAITNATDVLAGRTKVTAHETIFRSFVGSILGESEMPYTPQESYEANKTFLEVLSRLTGSPL